MEITIGMFTFIASVVIALLAGFWLGRSIRWMMQDTESKLLETNVQGQKDLGQEAKLLREEAQLSPDGARFLQEEAKRFRGKTERFQEKAERFLGYTIGSPVTGEVRTFGEGTRRGALLRPEMGKLYAPASGKIIKLYPMGNTMVLRTDWGVEIMMRVGDVKDELCGTCFRTSIVQNEVVHKGKLLLEFDREELQKEGVDPCVSVTVGAGAYRDIAVTQKERVKSGEELLWIKTGEDEET